MQDYLEEMREKEELDDDRYDKEYDRLIDDLFEIYKDELNILLSDIKSAIFLRESEIGFDLEIKEKCLLQLILDERF